MIDDILVSVVIPTYARNDALCRAIDCILAQTHKNLEIIVVDDNPADSEYRPKVEKIMAGYANDPRVRYIQNPQNLGGAGARNVGIEASKGEYIAFLDDDDVYYPQKIEKQLKLFVESNNDKLALVYCDVEHIGNSGKVDVVVRAKHRGNCLYEAIVDDCIASTSMWLVRKSAINAVDNFSIVPCKQDSTVIIKLLAAGYEVDFVPEILCQYYNVTGTVRISFGPKKIQGEEMFMELCRSHYDQFTKKQIRDIECAMGKRLYMLCSYKNRQFTANKEMASLKKRQAANMILKNDLLGGAFFIAKWQAHMLKWRRKKRK